MDLRTEGGPYHRGPTGDFAAVCRSAADGSE